MHKIVTKWTPYAFKLIIWYWLFFVQNKQTKKKQKSNLDKVRVKSSHSGVLLKKIAFKILRNYQR